jgi:sec-independent protein translocase protein TatA
MVAGPPLFNRDVGSARCPRVGQFASRDAAGGRVTVKNGYAPVMPFGIGIWELLILLLVLLLVFGPKRLPEMGRQLGKGMREFKESVSGSGKDDDHPIDDIAELPPAETEPSAATTSRERDTVS